MCGPSGAGKSSLLKRLIAERPNEFAFSVSHTTRAPRPGEVNGVDYHFVEKTAMEEKIKRGEMLEYARVHNNVYGTSISAVSDVIKSKRCILDIDVQGVCSLKETSLDSQSLYLFISPPSLEILEKRLRSRGTESEDKIRTRLDNARKEMEYKNKPDFWDAVITNDDLDRAYQEFLMNVIQI